MLIVGRRGLLEGGDVVMEDGPESQRWNKYEKKSIFDSFFSTVSCAKSWAVSRKQ